MCCAHVSTNEHGAAQGAWRPPLPDPVNLVVRYGDSIAEQFARGHDFPAILRELIQNEYDAGGSSVEVTFEPDALRVQGTGAAIGPDGWKRLSVVMGTGRVTGPEREEVEPKKNGIGSKNFGLRSLFVVGDTIHIRSGGFTSVLDLRAGVDRTPRPDPESQDLPGVEIYVPYRTAHTGSLEPFTTETEELALESAAASLGPALLKLAVPGARKSIERLSLRSVRSGRVLAWSQRAALLRCRLRSAKAIRRAVRFVDSLRGERTEQEMEFSRTVRIPLDQRGRDIPDYYRRPGGRITISVSIATRRGRPRTGAIGGWFYPIGVQGQSTGTALSVSAPFEMNEDRTALVPTSGSTWNRWLLDQAVSLTMNLLTDDWWRRFGPEAFVAAWPTDLERTEEPRFAATLRERMKREACWPVQAPRGAVRFRCAAELVVPETPALGGFLATERYAPDVALRCPGFVEALTQAGAKPFGLPSLVRLRCAGKDASSLSTRVNQGCANFYFENFEIELRNPDRQAQFARALDTFRRLPESARADLAGTYSTLSAAGTLEHARQLHRVPVEIADSSVPARSRLHPSLLLSRTFQRLAQQYDPYQWAREVASRAAEDDASEVERVALYGFIRQKRGRFPASLLSVLRAAPVLPDKDGAWAAPRELVLRRTPGRKDFGPVLRLPHSEVEADRELVKGLRIRDRLAASDLVALARWAAEDESRAELFERILLAQRRFWNSQAVRALSGISFLRSRAGGLARPGSLYVDSARLHSTVGEDASFVDSSLPRSFLTRLGCRTEPRADDILAHLGHLRRLEAAPAAPEVLYPELAAALHREHRRASELTGQPLLWTDAGWAFPEDVVLRTGPVRFPPGSLPRPLSGSAEMVEAYRRLGASPSPTERHWRYVLRWLAALHPNGDVIPRSHADIARAAYVHLGAAGGEFRASDTVLLGRDGRLYPITAANRKRFLLDDHPRLAAAVEAASLPYAFAAAAEANSVRFFQAVGVRALGGIAGSPQWKVGADRPPPPRLRVHSALARLHHPALPSALAAFVAQRVLRTGRGRELAVPAIGRRLARIDRLRFVQELAAVYRVGGKIVEVPWRIHVAGTEVLLSGVRGEAGVLSALAQMIARDLPGNDPAEWTDAVLGLLQCDDPDEMREYLADRNIAWSPPAAARHGAPPRDELSAALAEQLGFEVPEQADPPEEPDPQPSVPVNPPPAPVPPPPLPPLEDVQPIWEAPTGAVVAERSVGSGGGKGGNRTPPRDDVQDRRIGYRGEELVYLHERARVSAAGLPADNVVWVARDNPMADHDIRSVREDGQTIWIEVKATTGCEGRFRWSRAEINLATRKREHYLLYRVYKADSTHPVIKVFPNPASLFLTGRLRLDVAVLQAEVEEAE